MIDRLRSAGDGDARVAMDVFIRQQSAIGNIELCQIVIIAEQLCQGVAAGELQARQPVARTDQLCQRGETGDIKL